MLVVLLATTNATATTTTCVCSKPIAAAAFTSKAQRCRSHLFDIFVSVAVADGERATQRYVTR